MPSDETVADVLSRLFHSGHQELWPVLRYVEGNLPASALDVEDWTLGLKLAGGKLTLRFDYATEDVIYVTSFGMNEPFEAVMEHPGVDPAVRETWSISQVGAWLAHCTPDVVLTAGETVPFEVPGQETAQ